MRTKSLLCLFLGIAMVASAKEPRQFQRGTLLQMDSVPCGMNQRDGQTFAAETLSSDSNSQKTQETLCQEYLLQADQVLYHIRPRDQKRAVLLPLGGEAQFRLEKDKMLLRVQDLDQKERQYVVVSITPRSDASTADAVPVHLNHLQ